MVVDNRILPFSLPRGCPVVSHLSFADDLVVFTRGDRRSLRQLVEFLEKYENATGQRINRDKSSFFVAKQCTLSAGRGMSAITGIRQGSFPFQYLGCQLYRGRCKVEYFQPLLDKVDAKLAGWRARLLSIGGRLLLIRHVLSSMPVHMLAAMHMPKTILSQLEKRFNGFLWGDNEGQPKRRWRSWSQLAFPVDEGGIGVRRLTDVQAAFNCKLWWKYKNQLGSWAKYMSSGDSPKFRSRAWKRLQSVDDFMAGQVGVLVNNGNASFWYDDWSGRGPLKDKCVEELDFPPALAIRDVFVDGQWNLQQFLGLLPQEDLDAIAGLHFEFRQEPDQYVWKSHSLGAFSVSSAFQSLRQRRAVNAQMKVIWNQRIPLRVSVFMWRLLHSLLPFDDVLTSMGFFLASKCVFCCNSDGIHHFFSDCRTAREVWDFFGTKLQLHFRMGDLWTLLQDWWEHDSHRTVAGELKQLLPSFICWELWKAKNVAVFDDCIVPPHRIIAAVLQHVHNSAEASPFVQLVPADLRLITDGLLPSLRPQKRLLLTSVIWNFPPHNCFKLNVDGSSRGNPGPAAGGIVIRDHMGMVVASRSISYGIQTSFFAEVNALIDGLALCSQLELTDVLAETDSKVLADLLKFGNNWPWRYRNQLSRLATTLQQNSYQVHFIYREANAVADGLARLGSSAQTTTSYSRNTLPPSIRGLIAMDQQQIPYIRIR